MKSRYASHVVMKKIARTSSPTGKKYFCGIRSWYCLLKSPRSLTTGVVYFQSGVPRCATTNCSEGKISLGIDMHSVTRAQSPPKASEKSCSKENYLIVTYSFPNLFWHGSLPPSPSTKDTCYSAVKCRLEKWWPSGKRAILLLSLSCIFEWGDVSAILWA